MNKRIERQVVVILVVGGTICRQSRTRLVTQPRHRVYDIGARFVCDLENTGTYGLISFDRLPSRQERRIRDDLDTLEKATLHQGPRRQLFAERIVQYEVHPLARLSQRAIVFSSPASSSSICSAVAGGIRTPITPINPCRNNGSVYSLFHFCSEAPRNRRRRRSLSIRPVAFDPGSMGERSTRSRTSLPEGWLHSSRLVPSAVAIVLAYWSAWLSPMTRIFSLSLCPSVGRLYRASMCSPGGRG